jgi:hypothetical protein
MENGKRKTENRKTRIFRFPFSVSSYLFCRCGEKFPDPNSRRSNKKTAKSPATFRLPVFSPFEVRFNLIPNRQ